MSDHPVVLDKDEEVKKFKGLLDEMEGTLIGVAVCADTDTQLGCNFHGEGKTMKEMVIHLIREQLLDSPKELRSRICGVYVCEIGNLARVLTQEDCEDETA